MTIGLSTKDKAEIAAAREDLEAEPDLIETLRRDVLRLHLAALAAHDIADRDALRVQFNQLFAELGRERDQARKVVMLRRFADELGAEDLIGGH